MSSTNITKLAKEYIYEEFTNNVKTITDIDFYNDDFISLYNDNVVLCGTGKKSVVIGTHDIDNSNIKLHIQGDININGNILKNGEEFSGSKTEDRWMGKLYSNQTLEQLPFTDHATISDYLYSNNFIDDFVLVKKNDLNVTDISYWESDNYSILPPYILTWKTNIFAESDINESVEMITSNLHDDEYEYIFIDGIHQATRKGNYLSCNIDLDLKKGQHEILYVVYIP